MSILFQTDDGSELWWPASAIARLFHDQLASIGRHLLGIESGLGPIEADEIAVDREAFLAFTDAFHAHLGNAGERTHAMVGVAFGIALLLAGRLGRPIGDDPVSQRYLEQGRRLVG
ncbi:MAG: hypothetical protein HOO96_15795 [Polyangiaceae bacterium]|nr:hypothetical protein [Polyangiaceae bacterium]